MSEKIKPHIEHDLSQQEKEKLGSVIAEYLSEKPNHPAEFIDKDLDNILNRYVEKGPELSPDVKIALRNAIRRLLGIEWDTKLEEKSG